MYTFDSRIRYSECDREGKLCLESLLDYFQDSSSFHSEDIGLGTEFLEAHHLTWVLNNWQIIFEEAPKLGEQVEIGTIPYELKGFLGKRNFIMKAKNDGRTLAYANSLWTLIDLETMRPTKALPEQVQGYTSGTPLEMEYAPRKITLPENGEEKEPIFIQNYHLDTNNHVNNGQYLRMAMAYLPQGFRVREMRAEYKKAALLGDTVIPVCYMNEERNIMTVALTNEKNDAYAIIQLMQ